MTPTRTPRPPTRRQRENADRKRLTELRRRVSRARKFPINTDPFSRHLHLMADCLLRPKKGGGLRYPMLEEEPEHCAESMLVVLANLWEDRTKLARLQAISRGGKKGKGKR